MRVLARIVAHGAGRWEGRPDGLAAELAWAELDDAGRRDVVRALRATGAPELFMLAAPIAAPREPGSGVRTRVEAFRLMAEAAAPSHAAVMAPGLADSSRRVRAAAAAALARCGEAGTLAAEELLGSSRWYEAEGAALTLALQHGRRAEECLLDSQRAVFSSVADGLCWSAALPAGDLRFDRLQVALGDLFRRSVDRTLLVLGGLGHERVVESARRVLHGAEGRLGADAVEALASLRRSGFVQPLLALLERWDAGQGAYVPAAAPLPPDRGPSEVLAEAVASPDRWVRIGAALTAAELGLEVPSGLDADADELVRRVAHALHEADGAAPAGRDHPMNRLFFLKKTELFGQLSLDDLLVIDGVTRQEDFLAGQVVCRQGTEGHELYVVYRGEVVVEREVDGEQVPVATLGPGEPLGEMALFDALPRSATVVAKTDCTLLVLQHRQFLHIAEQRPEILTEVARVLSHRIRGLEERLV